MTLVCPSCNRSLALSGAILKRRKCLYCEAPVPIPEELQDEARPTAAPKGALQVSCPLCGRSERVAGMRAGKPMTCTVCACPFTIPDASGSCLDPKSEPFEPAAPPLEQVRSVPLIVQACRARPLSPAEAQALGDGVSRLAKWSGRGEEVSPLGPEPSAGIAEHLILRVTDTRSNPTAEGGVRLRIYVAHPKPILPAGDQGELPLAVQMNVYAANLDKPLSKGRRADVLDFLPSPGGTVLRGHVQDAKGNLAAMKAADVETRAHAIRRAIRPHARRLLTLWALFGPWVTAAMLPHVSKESVNAKLKALGID